MVIAVFPPFPPDMVLLAVTLLFSILLLTRSWIVAIRRDRLRQQQECPVSGREDVAVTERASLPLGGDVSQTRAEPLDVEEEAHHALLRLDGMAARQGVRFEVAVQVGLMVRMPRVGLQRVLDDVLGRAIAQSPGGKVMIAAMRHGGRIQIAVLDDGTGSDRVTQESRLRDSMQTVALLGGTFELNTHAGEGTTVVIRLPEPSRGAVSPDTRKAEEVANPVSTEVNDGVRASMATPANAPAM